ncbi:glycoside hydrolase superfamily [Kalaharituber pfeilii]|nr:glycoside hydrolase superfamily [Kalaharituber pfeilii]
MKWDSTESSQGSFNFGNADYLVNYAQTNGKKRTYSCLAQPIANLYILCASSCIVIIVANHTGVSNINSASTLTQVIQNHVTTSMIRYKGKIHHWDVVNEVFEDNSNWRNSVFYRLLGESFVDIALRAAAADPVAKLYINDYNLDYTGAKLKIGAVGCIFLRFQLS